MAVPDERFETVAAQLNARPEVAHNYQRAHALNMWFVIAAESPDRIERVITEIESETGLTVIAMPKLEEFFIGARFEA
jgi:siroheme decarboxylase